MTSSSGQRRSMTWRRPRSRELVDGVVRAGASARRSAGACASGSAGRRPPGSRRRRGRCGCRRGAGGGRLGRGRRLEGLVIAPRVSPGVRSPRRRWPPPPSTLDGRRAAHRPIPARGIRSRCESADPADVDGPLAPGTTVMATNGPPTFGPTRAARRFPPAGCRAAAEPGELVSQGGPFPIPTDPDIGCMGRPGPPARAGGGGAPVRCIRLDPPRCRRADRSASNAPLRRPSRPPSSAPRATRPPWTAATASCSHPIGPGQRRPQGSTWACSRVPVPRASSVRTSVTLEAARRAPPGPGSTGGRCSVDLPRAGVRARPTQPAALAVDASRRARDPRRRRSPGRPGTQRGIPADVVEQLARPRRARRRRAPRPPRVASGQYRAPARRCIPGTPEPQPNHHPAVPALQHSGPYRRSAPTGAREVARCPCRTRSTSRRPSTTRAGSASCATSRAARRTASSRDALTVLANLEHRGASGSERNTGDGAGILVAIPHAFFARRRPAEAGVDAPRGRRLRRGEASSSRATPPAAAPRSPSSSGTLAAEGLGIIGWRDVPTDPTGLGESALGQPCPSCARRSSPARRTWAAARTPTSPSTAASTSPAASSRRRSSGAPCPGRGDFYVPSMSCRTIVYKGMLNASQLLTFYPDLLDPRLRERGRPRPLAVLHQHLPVLGPRAPVPLHQPQRRDQHAPRQRQLDVRAPVHASGRRSSATTCARSCPRWTWTAPTPRSSTTSWSCSTSAADRSPT